MGRACGGAAWLIVRHGANATGLLGGPSTAGQLAHTWSGPCFGEQLILRIADRGRTENLLLRSKSTPLRLCGRRAHSTKPPIDPLQRTMTLGKICNFWTHQRVKVLPCGSADGVPTQRSHRSFHSLMIQTESLKISCARRSSTSDKLQLPSPTTSPSSRRRSRC